MCVRAHARVCAKIKTDFGPGTQFEPNITAMNMQGNCVFVSNRIFGKGEN